MLNAPAASSKHNLAQQDVRATTHSDCRGSSLLPLASVLQFWTDESLVFSATLRLTQRVPPQQFYDINHVSMYIGDTLGAVGWDLTRGRREKGTNVGAATPGPILAAMSERFSGQLLIRVLVR
jgi:hypothetical protein